MINLLIFFVDPLANRLGVIIKLLLGADLLSRFGLDVVLYLDFDFFLRLLLGFLLVFYHVIHSQYHRDLR